jgi:tRNA G18 (ribose-2'-O)-methylase SpoU
MRELHLIAHDIRSKENVGALFRTCDSLGVARLWLTGYTAAPPDEKISKVALGAEKTVSFVQHVDIDQVFRFFTEQGIPVYALELTKDAVDLARFQPPDRMALLLGTERTGVPASLLSRCEGEVFITQHGLKESMNVGVAAGIAAWSILNKI